MNESENLRLLYTRGQIKERTEALAARIESDFAGGEFLCVCVLKGAFMFFSDLIRHFGGGLETAFIRLSSYGDKTRSSGEVKRLWDFTENAAGKEILIVDDIADSGLTLEYLKNYFLQKGAKSVRAVCLLDKPFNRVNNARPDYCAFTLKENRFVVGYGMDYAERYRNLDAVYYIE